MLYLDIQKGEEAMNILEFKQETGGTATCTSRIINGTEGCGQMSKNGTYFSDSWFSRGKKSKEASAEGVDYCKMLNTSHKGFFLVMLENLMK